MATQCHIWLRAESKENEQRAALTPESCKVLLTSEPKCRVTVEKSNQRIFKDDEYEGVGCQMVEAGAWTNAPKDAYIVGIKELPEVAIPIEHIHIYFGHCYKEQVGWEDLLNRFREGGGMLLDVEYMCDNDGRRAIAEFGPVAGFVGAAVGLDVWSHQTLQPTTEYPSLSPSASSDELVSHVKENLQKAITMKGLDTTDDKSFPKVMVLGALGRCGKGAIDALQQIGIPEDNITKWDLEETPKSGPVAELLDYHVLLNCINLNVSGESKPLFVNMQVLSDAGEKRVLSVVVDVSCDASNPSNPLPIYSEITTIAKPTIRIPVAESTLPLDVVAIDHLPSLLPRESSVRFSEKLFPYLQELPRLESNDVLKNAKAQFEMHIRTLEDLEALEKGARRRNCKIL